MRKRNNTIPTRRGAIFTENRSKVKGPFCKKNLQVSQWHICLTTKTMFQFLTCADPARKISNDAIQNSIKKNHSTWKKYYSLYTNPTKQLECNFLLRGYMETYIYTVACTTPLRCCLEWKQQGWAYWFFLQWECKAYTYRPYKCKINDALSQHLTALSRMLYWCL